MAKTNENDDKATKYSAEPVKSLLSELVKQDELEFEGIAGSYVKV